MTVSGERRCAAVELRDGAAAALALADPGAKCAAVAALQAARVGASYVLDRARELLPPDLPGRPERPVLVHPARVPKRRLGTPAGRAALIHALAHIEFNAINLALDALARFAGLPAAYYFDWLTVAHEEALHFGLLRVRLTELGHAYGDFVAHDGLWEAAFKTRHDVLARMALVPRVLEARGLDVTPGLQRRLRAAGDDASASILEVILRDEVTHVAIGNRWFAHMCEQRELDPQATFFTLCDLHALKRPQPPFNLEARRRAGFDEAELSALQASSRN